MLLKLFPTVLFFLGTLAPLQAGNKAPTGADRVITVIEDSRTAFSSLDFGFRDAADTPPDALTNVVIASLPAAGRGTLLVNGIAATVGQVVRATPASSWQVLGTVSGYGQHGTFASSNDGRRLIATFTDSEANVRTLQTSADMGMTWTVRPITFGIASVASSADGLKLAVAVYLGRIFISSDGGETWTERASNQRWNAIAMSDDGTRLVGVVGSGGQIYTSADSGVTWTARDSNRDWYTVACSASGTHMLASTFGGKLYVSSDSGVTWTERESDRNWSSVAVSASGSRMIAGRTDGDLAISNDFGVTWTLTPPLTYSASIALSDDGQQLISTTAGSFLRLSTDGGVTWTNLGTSAQWGHVALAPDGSRYFARTQDGILYTSHPVIHYQPALNNIADAVFTFNVEDSGTANTRDLSANKITLTFTPVNDTPVLAAPIPDQSATEAATFGYAFPATTFTDPDLTAFTYTATLVGGAPLPAWVNFTPASRSFAGTPKAGDVGTLNILVTARDPGGLSATDTFRISIANVDYPPQGKTGPLAIAPNLTHTFQRADFGFSDPNDIPPHRFERLKIVSPLPSAGTLLLNGAPVSAGDSFSVQRGMAGGTWQTKTAVYGQQGLAISEDGTKLVVLGSGDSPYISSDSGQNWTPSGPALSGWNGLSGSSTLSHLVAGVYANQLRVSTDGGATWTARGPSAGQWRDTACSADGSRMYAVTDDISGATGTIYVSTDSGTTWAATTGYTSQYWNSIDCSDDGLFVVVASTGSTGQLMTSNDGGATWQLRETARRWTSVACSANGRTVIACVGNGKLYVSNDGGETWTERDAVRNWKAVACSSTGRRLFAAAIPNDKVYASSDGGATWTPSGDLAAWSYVACSADGSLAAALGNSQYLRLSTGVAAPTLTFTPATGVSGQAAYAKLTFQVEDAGAAGSNLDLTPDVLTLNVGILNLSPVLVSPLADVSVNEGSPMLIQVPTTQFTEPNAGQKLTLSATRADGSPLPTWLTFNPATRLFTGTPQDADVGPLVVHLKATDDGTPPITVTDEFVINVLNVDYPPQGQDKTFTVNEGEAQHFTDSDFGFSDVGDAVPHSFTAFKITELPAEGEFWVNGAIHSVGDVITMPPGPVRYTPPLASLGTPYGRIGFQVIDSGTDPQNIDPTPNYFILNVTKLPVEIAVDQGSTPLTDGVSTVDFGTYFLGAGSEPMRQFTLSNLGTGGLRIISVAVDGPQASDFEIDFLPASVIAGGADSPLQITFRPDSIGTRRATLHIVTNDVDETSFDIELTAESRGSAGLMVLDEDDNALVTGSELNFGNLAVGSSTTRNLFLLNNGTAAVTIQGFTLSNSSNFSLPAITNLTIQPGGRFTVPVTFTDTGLGFRGTFLGIQNTAGSTITITTFATVVAATDQEIQVELPEGSPIADAAPVTDFGSTNVGGSQTLTGLIRNQGTKPLKNIAVSITGAHAKDFTLTLEDEGEIPGGLGRAFEITFSPLAVGARSALIRIASDDANENPYDIAVAGQGLVPEISLEQPTNTPLVDNKSEVNFGNAVAIGSPASLTFTVRNTGSGPLNLQATPIVIDGADAADFSVSAAPGLSTLPPGGSTTFELSFTPSASVKRSAVLHLLSDDADESAYDIRLTGTGNGPEISVESPVNVVLSPTVPLDLGSAVTGSTLSRAFTLRNTGTTALTVSSVSFMSAEGPFSITGATFPANIPAKGTLIFNIAFSPTLVGPTGNTLSISSNDADESDVFINLNAAGVSTLGAAAPAFTLPPQPQIVALGQPASFTATVTPSTGLRYQWSRGSGTRFTDIAKATTTTLTLPAVTLADAAQLYRLRALRVSDAKIFTDSQPAALTVVDRAARRANLPDGGTAVFSVNAASTGILRYLWRKEGAELPSDARFSGGTTRQLTITSLDPSDAGTYTCEVSGPGGTLSGGANVLTIFSAAPQIDPQPLVLPAGIVSGEYSYPVPLGVSSGTPTTWTATGLPRGLTINALTGVISGRPTTASAASPFSFTVRAENSLGFSQTSASLVVQPFPTALTGSYMGLISRSAMNQGLGGRLDLTVSNTGAATGKLILGSNSLTLPAGQVSPELGTTFASYRASITRRGLPNIALELRIDTNRSRIILGSVSDGSEPASEITGWKNTWSAARLSSDYDGSYNFAFQIAGLTPGSPALPQGHGFGSCKVGTKGESISITGRTPDGESFTSTCFLGPDGDFAVFSLLKSKGSLHGTTGILLGTSPTFTDNSVASGEVTLSRAASSDAKSNIYPAGFSAQPVSLSGGSYSVQGSVVMNRPAGPDAAYLSFMEAGLFYPSPAARWLPLSAGASLNLLPTGAAATSVKLDRTTGAFSGQFTLTDVHPVTPSAARIVRKVSFQGLLIPTPTGHRGRGHFLLQQLPTPVFPPPPVLPTLSGAAFVE